MDHIWPAPSFRYHLIEEKSHINKKLARLLRHSQLRIEFSVVRRNSRVQICVIFE